MKIIDLLKEIEKGEINESIFYVNGDFFYDLIVIDKNLYVINTMTKQLELLQSKYISKFIRDNVELLRLDNFEETPIISKLYINNELQYDLEEEKKIPEKVDFDISNFNYKEYELNIMRNNVIANTQAINLIIDYLKSKGDE